MGAVVGLLLLLLLIGVSHGLETYCDGRKDGAQCYGALRGTVNLRLMNNASEIPKYEWWNKSTKILNGRKNNILSNNLSSRSVFTPSNGTFRINDLSRTDSGEYKLILFNSDLQKSEERTLHLSVQDNLPLIGGVLTALLIFLIVGVAVICYKKKKQRTKPEEEGDDKELTYADINFTQQSGTQVEQRADLEVEYGQVKFSE